jgi:hypothetical protein
MEFPICRHGAATETPTLRHCRSPKLAGLKLVSAAQCERCHCRDHEPVSNAFELPVHLVQCAHLGEPVILDAELSLAEGARKSSQLKGDGKGFYCRHPQHGRTTLQHCRSCLDYLFSIATPNMPLEMIRRLIALPAREQAADWWQWDNVQVAHREAAASAIERTSACPAQYQGRGIVVVGGGRYFVSAYVTIRVIRELGCRLPIELWHLNEEIDAQMLRQLAPYDVQCINAEEVAQNGSYRFITGHWWRGWQLKAFALRNCSFREVLLLDADSYPVRNPEFLFDWPRYREWGAVFWPDLESNKGMIPSEAWSIFGVDPIEELPTESGQLLVNKELCWRELNLALHYNSHADFVYRIVYGDKDTFPIAWRRLGRRYARMWPTSTFESVAIRQADDRGELLFLHRVHDKFRLPATRFSATPQQFEQNKFHPQFPLEQFCFDVVAELAGSGFQSPLLAENKSSELIVSSEHAMDAMPVTEARPQQIDRTPLSEESLETIQSVLPALTVRKSVVSSIEEMYPAVPVELLVSEAWQQRFQEYFLDTQEFPVDPFEIQEKTARPHKKCISVCLFKQNVNNRVPNEFPVNEQTWKSKYWAGLLGVVADLAYFPDWKLRIYVEPALWYEVYLEFASHPQIELYRMAVNTIGANPGSFWRFLALADQSLDLVLETDIDESLRAKWDYIQTFELDSHSAVGRIGGFISDRHYLVDPPDSPVKNFATMIGSCVMSRPARVDFDMSAAIRGFMAHRRYYSQTDQPWAYSDSEPSSPYNLPIGSHIYGWGSHWYMYCFDERFLKHVMYYHFAQKSELQTWAFSSSPAQKDPEGLWDYEYVRQRGNTIVFPHTAVRLASLKLSSEALRIAFVLDEYRWIFDALLRIVQDHANDNSVDTQSLQTQIDPHDIEALPGNINLFKAAQFRSKALELGFNAGFHAAVMLLANRDLTIDAYQKDATEATRLCGRLLNEVFGDRLTLVEVETPLSMLPESGNIYDFMHIDAIPASGNITEILAQCVPRCEYGAAVVVNGFEDTNDVNRATKQLPELKRTESYTLHSVPEHRPQAIFLCEGADVR